MNEQSPYFLIRIPPAPRRPVAALRTQQASCEVVRARLRHLVARRRPGVLLSR